MSDVQEQVSVPQNSSAVSNALGKLFMDIVAAKNSGLSGAALVTDAVELSVADLAGVIGNVSGIGGEAQAEPIGVAEAFTVAGFSVARQLTGK